MKRLILTCTFIAITSFIPKKTVEMVVAMESISISHIDVRSSNDSLLKALIYVESSNSDKAYNESEDAVGCLQIRRLMVRDINRILKLQGSKQKFKMRDRWDRDKSIQMFNIYCEHYNIITNEDRARCWNGGPKGFKKRSTDKYWKKVLYFLNNN